MTREEFEMFKSLKEKLEHEVEELFDYIKEKYLYVLAFGRCSCYYSYDRSDDTIFIEYLDCGYDGFDSRDIEIPINDFLSNPFEWADNWANNIRAKEQKEKDEALKRIEEKEKEELKRLKDKYEN